MAGRTKTKTKKTVRGSKTVTIKNGKRTVTKYDKQGRVRKVKGGGKVSKPTKGKTTTRKAQVKKGAKTAANIAAGAAGFASPLYAPGIAKAGILGGAGAGFASKLKEGLDSLEGGRKRLKKSIKDLKTRKKTVTKKGGVKTKKVTQKMSNRGTTKTKMVTKKVGSARKRKQKSYKSNR